MKSGKTAICLSGLIRTGIEAHPCFQRFFSRLDNYDVFYHTWQTDEVTSNKIYELYSPTSFLQEAPLEKMAESSFGSMLYSIMMANELKKKHEIENDFRYDLVIKTRFDLVVDEHSFFPTDPIWPRTIYNLGTNVGLNHTDYENHGISDLIFWGDSQSMDIATNVYRYYKNVALVKNVYLRNGWKLDPQDYYLSPGTMIYQRTVQRNIAHIKCQTGIRETLWREDIKHLNPLKDFEKIRNRYAKK